MAYKNYNHATLWEIRDDFESRVRNNKKAETEEKKETKEKTETKNSAFNSKRETRDDFDSRVRRRYGSKAMLQKVQMEEDTRRREAKENGQPYTPKIGVLSSWYESALDDSKKRIEENEGTLKTLKKKIDIFGALAKDLQTKYRTTGSDADRSLLEKTRSLYDTSAKGYQKTYDTYADEIEYHNSTLGEFQTYYEKEEKVTEDWLAENPALGTIIRVPERLPSKMEGIPKDPREAFTLAEQASRQKSISIVMPDGGDTVQISPAAYYAMQNGKLDTYAPVDEDEGSVLERVKAHLAERERQEWIKNNPVFAKYNINPEEFSFDDLDKWAEAHNYTWYHDENGRKIYDPKREKIFGFLSGKKLSTEQDDAEFNVLHAQASRNDREAFAKNHPVLGPVAVNAEYLAAKAAAGVVGTVENSGRYLTAGASWLVGQGLQIGGVAPNKAADSVLGFAGQNLEADGISDVMSRNAEERMTPHPAVRELGGVVQSAGNLVIPIVAEIMTATGSPLLELELARKAAQNTTLSTLKAASKKFFTPSSIVFGTSAAGGSAKEGYELSKDAGKSLVYGTLSGLGELMTEKIFGGFAGTDFGDALIEFNVKNKGLRKMLNFGSEGVEEMLMRGVEPKLKRISGVDKNARAATFSEILESGKQGVLLSLIMQTATYPIQKSNVRHMASALNDISEGFNAFLADNQKIEILDIKKATVEQVEAKQKEIIKYAQAYAEQLETTILTVGNAANIANELIIRKNALVEKGVSESDANAIVNRMYQTTGDVELTTNESGGAADIFGAALQITDAAADKMEGITGGRGGYSAVYAANLGVLKSADSQFDRAYVEKYAEAFVGVLQAGKAPAYTMLSEGGADAVQLLTDYVLTGKASAEITNANVLAEAAMHLRGILASAVQNTSDVHAKLYGENSALKAQVMAVQRGDFSALNIEGATLQTDARSNVAEKTNTAPEVQQSAPFVEKGVTKGTRSTNAAMEVTIGEKEDAQLIEDYSGAVDSILTVSDEVAKDLADKRTAVEVSSNTPKVILDHVEDARDLKVIVNYNTLYLAVRKDGVFKGHYHNLGADIAKKLPEFLKSPDAIIQLASGRLNLFATVETERGNNGIVSVELNSTKDIDGKNKDYNVVVTIFSSDNNYVQNLISSDGVTEKYKREDLSQVNPQLYKWLATINDKSSTDTSISQENTVVNDDYARKGGKYTQEETNVNTLFPKHVLPTAEELLPRNHAAHTETQAAKNAVATEYADENITEAEYDERMDILEAEASMAGESMLYDDGRKYSISGQDEEPINISSGNALSEDPLHPIDYDSLINKKDMAITDVDDSQILSRAEARALAKENVKSRLNEHNDGNTFFVHNKDTDTEIIVGTEGINHGLVRRYQDNAIVDTKIGEYIENAIYVNELRPREAGAVRTYVLLGYGESDSASYPAYFIVNIRQDGKHELKEYGVLSSGNAKKIAGTFANKATVGDGKTANSTSAPATISIKKLLDIVKEKFSEILPQSVLSHYGIARKNGKIGPYVRFSNEENHSLRTIEGSTNNEGRSVLSDGSGERTHSASSGKPVRKMDGRTSRYREGREAGRERRKYCETLRASGLTEEKVVYDTACEVIPKEQYTPRMRKIEAENLRNGIDETIFITGKARILSKKDSKGNHKMARGVYVRKDGRKTVLVQYDNEWFTPEQINDHERIHDQYNTRLVQKVKNIITNSLSASERKQVLEKLATDYNGIVEDNEEALIEEFVANVLSNMDYDYLHAFAELQKAFWKGDEQFIDSYKVSEYTESADAGGNAESLEQADLGEKDAAVPRYTEQEYRDYGWARANNILTAGQNTDYRSKFADAVSGMAEFPKSKAGEYIIPVSNIYDASQEGVNNVLVFAKGTIENPVITSVIKIDEYDETSLDDVRRRIYEGERRGIQQEAGELFRRYHSSAYEFRPNQQRTGAGSVKNSGYHGHGGRSGEKTSEAEGKIKVSYSAAGAEEMAKDKLPVKAEAALRQAESHLLGRIGEILSVPGKAQRETLQSIVRDISKDYLDRGAIDRTKADELFEAAWREGLIVNEDYYKQYKYIRDYLRSTQLTISEEDRTSIADFGDFRKRAFGKLRLVNEGGLPVDSAYMELEEMAPELFPVEITHPADQLMHMLEIADGIRKTEQTLDEAHGEDAEVFKEAAKDEFHAALNSAAVDFKRVKRYSDEQGRKTEKKEEEKKARIETKEEVQEAYKNLKATRRNLDKVTRKALLTDEDTVRVGQLLRGEINPMSLNTETDNVKDILAVYNAKKEYEQYAKRIRDWNRRRKEGLAAEAREYLGGMENWKDKKFLAGLRYSIETMERNFRDVMGEDAAALIAKYLNPVYKGNAEAVKLKEEMREKVRALGLSRKVASGNLVSEAHAVQLLGEAEDNITVLRVMPKDAKRDGQTLSEWEGNVKKLWAENPNLDEGKIREAVKTFREIYDTLFEKMNAVRVRNGYEPVNYRRGYFPHFQPGQEGVLAQFGRALGIDTSVSALPTTINGMTHLFRPGIQWFGNAKERLGFNTVYDAVEGFDKYIEGVSGVIYQTDNIQKLRALAKEIRYAASDEGVQKQVDRIEEREDLPRDEKDTLIAKLYEDAKFALSNFVVELEEYTNLLANKKSRQDRDMEYTLGRKMYNIMQRVNSNVSGAMVSLNIPSWLTNFIPLTQAWGLVDSKYLLRGMGETARAYFDHTDDFVSQSAFLTSRRGSDPLVKMWEQGPEKKNPIGKAWRGYQKAVDKLSGGMEYIDAFTADSIVRAKYLQNIDAGMSEAAAMEDADAFARGVMAGRSRGEMPTAFNATNPLQKLFTQFQLEVNNQYRYLFKDMPRAMRERGIAALAVALLKLFLGAWIFDELYELLFGRRPAMDLLSLLNEASGDFTGYRLPALSDLVDGETDLREENPSLWKGASNLVKNIGEELPFVGGVLFGGGRVPISSALPSVSNMGKALLYEKWDGKKKRQTLAKELSKPLLYMLPAGGQIKKIAEGADAMIRGGSYTVDADGNEILQYPVYNDGEWWETALNGGRAMLFGKTTLPTARNWVRSGFKSLSAKETELYKELTAAGMSGKEAFATVQEAGGTVISSYREFTDAGLTSENAIRLSIDLEKLTPEEGEETVSRMQRYKTVVAAKLPEAETMAALATMMEEGAYEKLTMGNTYGVAPGTYFAYLETLPKYDADENGSYKQPEVQAALDAMGHGGYMLPTADGVNRNLTKKQKAVLWQLADKSWKPKNNPYDVEIGTEIYDALHAE